MRWVETLADMADGLGVIFRSRGDRVVDLETAEFYEDRDLGTLVRPDGTLVSLVRVRGAQAVIGPEEMETFSRCVGDALTTALQGRGHCVDVIYRRDDSTVEQDIEAAIRPARQTARRLDMDVEWILDAKRTTLAEWCASEDCLLAIHTDYAAFSKSEGNQAVKDRIAESERHPLGRTSMNTTGAAAQIRVAHTALVRNIVEQLREARIRAVWLGAHAALTVIRREFDPEATSRNWRPLLPGDRLPVRLSRSHRRDDLSNLLYPTLREQLIPRAPGRVLRNRWVEIGDRIHAPVAMSLPPERVQSFDGLMRPLIENNVPFRIAFRLLPQGLERIGQLKKAIVSATDFLPGPNRQIHAALEGLQQMSQEGVTVIGMKVMADTWVRGDDEELLRNRSEYLSKAIQAWGQCESREITGDPLESVAATIPGLNRANPAPASAPPLREITPMLPLYRPSSPWESGAILFRSPDGKILPYQPASSLQNAWVTLGFAPMGKGKSVLLNAHNFALALGAGLTRLPYIAILDIGPSSTGLISLLQNSLPKGSEHLAMHRKLRMTPEDAINPFETPMGLRRPLPEHRAMLVDFLVTLATPEGETTTPDGVSGIAQTVIDKVFETLHPDNNPKVYDPKLDATLTEAVEAHNLSVDRYTSWFEIEDAFFDLGQTALASRAHRYAVPILPDCAQVAHDSAVTAVYAGRAATQESMPDYFWRTINEAISRYPVLSQPTQFSVGDARVVALDLAEVCPQGGASAKKQASIMYTLARYALAQRFYMDEGAVEFFPERYRSHYADHIAALKGEPKLQAMDEFHRTGGVNGIRRIVENDIREGRKFGVQVALFSQDANDFDEIFVRLSSTRFILGADTPDTADEVVRRFGLTGSARDVILNRITKPGRRGAGVYVSTRTDQGSGEMFGYLTLGPVELWAYNSTAKDRALRDRLYAQLGVRETLHRLARRFPAGTAVPEIEERQERAGERSEEASGGIIEALIREVMEAGRG